MNPICSRSETAIEIRGLVVVAGVQRGREVGRRDDDQQEHDERERGHRDEHLRRAEPERPAAGDPAAELDLEPRARRGAHGADSGLRSRIWQYWLPAPQTFSIVTPACAAAAATSGSSR